MEDSVRQALRSLPSVNDIVADARVAARGADLLPSIVTSVARNQQETARRSILAGHDVSPHSVVDAVLNDLNHLSGATSDIVINGTGVLIHTNLGRSPVSRATAHTMAEHAGRYQSLEVDMESGERGGRGEEIEILMRALSGAERTLVVNNNAAAVLLTLVATSAGREVVVSRGEAVEIGGGFRIPDVLQRSGARLVEVGTTNRTYIADYAGATSDQTAAYLKVHASNFSVVGFTASASMTDLAHVAKKHGVLLIEDAGSGCLLDTSDFGMQHEPTLTESIASGADVVCASGDKLLGGPQAGLILGSAEVVGEIARHPLARALRADKTCLAGLTATLRHYARGEATEHIPVWWAISRDVQWLEERVQGWQSELGFQCLSAVETESVVGGGSLPGRTQPSWALAIETDASNVENLAARLRMGSPRIMPRVADGRVAIDARTILEDEDEGVLEAVRGLLN